MLLNEADRPRRSVKRHDAIGGEDVQDCRHMSTRKLEGIDPSTNGEKCMDQFILGL
jgi:hypothetical protein